MDTTTILLVLIPAGITAAVSIASMVINYLKDKNRQEDKAWQTAEKIILSDKDQSGVWNAIEADRISDNFHVLYSGLKAIENGKYESFVKERPPRG